MLAGVVNDEAPGTLARKASTDSVLRSSSSEDDFYPGPPPRSQQMMRLLSLGSTVSSTSDVDVESPAENEDKDKIKHSGFCGYDSMLGISPPTTPGFDQMVPRRRIFQHREPPETPRLFVPPIALLRRTWELVR